MTSKYDMTFRRCLIVCISILLTLSACIPINVSESSSIIPNIDKVSYSLQWPLADLRVLDPVDAASAEQDIVAIYLHTDERLILTSGRLRNLQSGITLRVDFLDLPKLNHSDLLLALDYTSGGNVSLHSGLSTDFAWDLLFLIPAHGSIQIKNANSTPGSKPSIWITRDPELDFFTVHLTGLFIPRFLPQLHLQVLTLSPRSSIIADRSAPFCAEGVPPSPVPIMFAFWNTFPAYTPAQALRRWDGAHTGPYGGRHGLYNLLRAARNHQIPLALLDLKYPSTLPSLDYVNGLHLVQDMLSQDLLILPDVIPTFTKPNTIDTLEPLNRDMLTYLADFNAQTALNFNLPSSQFLFAPLTPSIPRGHPVVFFPSNAPSEGETQPMRWREQRLIPVPTQTQSPQANSEGLSLAVRRSLIQAAILRNFGQGSERTKIFLLGGDLTKSEWGVPSIARTGFRYIKAHSWIHPLGIHDLITTEVSPQIIFDEDSTSLLPLSQSKVSPLLQTLFNHIPKYPQTRFTQAATQMLLAAYAPHAPAPPELSLLRSRYMDHAVILSFADQWASAPYAISTCQADPDMDGTNECILANTSSLYIFEPEDGSLTFAFVLTRTGAHQIIAPSSQFIFGMSDATRWNLDLGLRADPDVIGGAFSDNFGPYQVLYGDDWLIMQNDGMHKTFRLISKGLLVDYQTTRPTQVQIPLAIDPWERFHRGWEKRYSGHSIHHGWEWGIPSAITVRIQSHGDTTHDGFKDTHAQMSLPENPNADQAKGYYLPFPLSLVTISAQGRFDLTITYDPYP